MPTSPSPSSRSSRTSSPPWPTCGGPGSSWLPLLAALKAAGAAGLLVGLLGNVRLLGISAAIGLTLFFTGALIAHLRARVFHNMHYPGAYWLLAIASAVLAVAR